MDIDKLETTIERLVEKANALNYHFASPSLEKEAQMLKEGIVESLESYLELAQEDSENNPDNTQDDE